MTADDGGYCRIRRPIAEHRLVPLAARGGQTSERLKQLDRRFITLSRRFPNQAQALFYVCFTSESIYIIDAKEVLTLCTSLFGGFAQPSQRFSLIFFDAYAFHITSCKLAL